MSNATWSLQQAVHARLAANAPLLALLGGPRIHDDVPQGAAFPYVTFGAAAERDWSTGSDTGAEITLSLHAWSRGAGRKEALAIADAIRDALHNQPLTLAGHRLVNLRHFETVTRRPGDGDTYEAEGRFRAITEEL